MNINLQALQVASLASTVKARAILRTQSTWSSQWWSEASLRRVHARASVHEVRPPPPSTYHLSSQSEALYFKRCRRHSKLHPSSRRASHRTPTRNGALRLLKICSQASAARTGEGVGDVRWAAGVHFQAGRLVCSRETVSL